MNSELLYLKNGLLKSGIDLNETCLLSMLQYKALLLEKNKVMNLTAIKDDEEFIERNIIDSLSVLEFVPENSNLIDVGTGAGMPGVFLKLAKPSVEISFLDSVGKKLDFIDEALTSMSIKGYKIIHARAEDAARDKNLRERYDVCTARAVAVLPVLCEYCMPLVKSGGTFIAMKGKNAEKEISLDDKIPALFGGKISCIREIVLPYSNIMMKPVIIGKQSPTSDKYPRAIKEINKISDIYKEKLK